MFKKSSGSSLMKSQQMVLEALDLSYRGSFALALNPLTLLPMMKFGSDSNLNNQKDCIQNKNIVPVRNSMPAQFNSTSELVSPDTGIFLQRSDPDIRLSTERILSNGEKFSHQHLSSNRIDYGHVSDLLKELMELSSGISDKTESGTGFAHCYKFCNNNNNPSSINNSAGMEESLNEISMFETFIDDTLKKLRDHQDN